MKKFSFALVLIAAASWGTMGLFVRKLSALGFGTFQLVVARALMTAAVIFLILAVTDREKLKIHIKDLWLFLLSSLVSIILFNFCYMNAINCSTMSLAATLLYTAPIFVTIISAFMFKEKITPLKIVALSLSFAGCILVSGFIGTGETVSVKALVFGIGAGLTYGLYSIFSKLALRKYDPLTFTAYTFLFAAIMLIPFCGIKTMGSLVAAKSGSLPLLMLFALVTNVIPYICYTSSLKYIEAGKASITATLEPVVATIIGIFVYKEGLTFISFSGIALVIFSAVLLNIPHKSKKEA